MVLSSTNKKLGRFKTLNNYFTLNKTNLVFSSLRKWSRSVVPPWTCWRSPCLQYVVSKKPFPNLSNPTLSTSQQYNNIGGKYSTLQNDQGICSLLKTQLSATWTFFALPSNSCSVKLQLPTRSRTNNFIWLCCDWNNKFYYKSPMAYEQSIDYQEIERGVPP